MTATQNNLGHRLAGGTILIFLMAFNLLATVAPPAQFVPGQILVKPSITSVDSEFAALLKAHGAVERLVIGALDVRVLSVPEDQTEFVLAALRQSPLVEFAERDYHAWPALVPDDPHFVSGAQWHLAKLQMPAAWDITTGTMNVIIAVVDSGLDASHPDLADNVLPGYDFVSNDNNPNDDTGHGTAVAGAVAAVGNNGLGVAGVAFGCRVMPLKIVSANTAATYSRMAQAVTYATDHGARVINISLAGSSASSTLQNAINYAWSRNVVIVAAAGNDGNTQPRYPAASQNVIAVSATDANDRRAAFSSYGSFITLAAPGTNIWTTRRSASTPYGPVYGTSFASPVVAGLAALVASANPLLSNTQIVSLLKFNADDLGAAGRDIVYGYGRVNGFSTLRSATNTVSPEIQGVVMDNGSAMTLSWSAVPGRDYRVEYAPSFFATNWTALGPDLTATNKTLSYTDQINGPQRFYRIIQLP
ncbi:MAG: S8 family serine peptidase [Verrucomicrobia bacterium]|nr:S8 family serine peptidase [Verrucomicrobiota bacterium]